MKTEKNCPRGAKCPPLSISAKLLFFLYFSLIFCKFRWRTVASAVYPYPAGAKSRYFFNKILNKTDTFWRVSDFREQQRMGTCCRKNRQKTEVAMTRWDPRWGFCFPFYNFLNVFRYFSYLFFIFLLYFSFFFIFSLNFFNFVELSWSFFIFLQFSWMFCKFRWRTVASAVYPYPAGAKSRYFFNKILNKTDTFWRVSDFREQQRMGTCCRKNRQKNRSRYDTVGSKVGFLCPFL